jgi:MYXO-CTERM domain-containing protein
VPFLADSTVREGSDGWAAIELSHPAPPGDKLHVTIRPGSATPDEDFRSGFRVLYLRGGETRVPLPLEVFGDRQAECDEGVLIEYSFPANPTEPKRTARILIQDEDGLQPLANCAAPFVAGPVPQPVDGVGQPDAGVDARSPSVQPSSPPALDAGPGPGVRLAEGGCALADGMVPGPWTLLLLVALPLWRRRR